MNDRDRRRYQRLTRVQTFGRERATEFAPGGTAGTVLTTIDRHLTDLESAMAAQLPERVDKSVLVRALTETCKQISSTARAIARHDPNFIGVYKVPIPITELSLHQTPALAAPRSDRHCRGADPARGFVHPAGSVPPRNARRYLRLRSLECLHPRDFGALPDDGRWLCFGRPECWPASLMRADRNPLLSTRMMAGEAARASHAISPYI